MFWPLTFIIAALTTFWLRWRLKNKKLLEVAKRFPGPTPLPFLGNAIQFMCQPSELITVINNLTLNYGDAVRFWLGPDLNVVISDPDELKALLTNTKTSVKGPQYKYMADFLGGGILSGSGSKWKKHRKIAIPNYSKRATEGYNEIFNKEIDLLLENFRQAPMGEMMDINYDVVRTTTYSACQSLMGLTREQITELPYLQHIIDETPRLYDIVFDRMTKWYLQIDPIFWLSKSYQAQKNFIKVMTEFSSKIIQLRKTELMTLTDKHKVELMGTEEDTQSNTELSVIDRFILSQELSNEEMLNETFTIFTSSQEASAKITSHLLLMMAYHPECQEKLYAEIKSVIGDEDRWVSNDDLKMMPYLDMVYKEVLRLFPIGALVQRSILEDIPISSGVLPAGCSLVVPIYYLHRDPRFWRNPEDFDPERFNPENSKTRHPNCYIPFSLGPMDCLGRYFGTKLIKTICVRVLREFRLTSTETYKDLKLFIAISASSLNGCHAILHPRK